MASLKAELLGTVAGRGSPAEPRATAVDSLAMEAATRLRDAWAKTEGAAAEEVRKKVEGNWRLVFTTDDAVGTISGMPGGPARELWEAIHNDVVHTAAPTKAPVYGVLMLLTFAVQVFVGMKLRLGFLGGVHLVFFFAGLLTAAAPTGLFASRRKGFNVSDALVASSRLERDAICFVASRVGFDHRAVNPLPDFLVKFDAAEGAKDPLVVGLLLGWRLVRQTFSLHVLSGSKGAVRHDQILFVDDQVRVTLGGVESVTGGGVASQALNVFVRVPDSSS